MAINLPTQFYDVSVKAIAGCAIGILSETNAALWALIFATQSISRLALSQLGNVILGKKFSAKAIDDYAEFGSHIGTAYVLQHVSLIVLRTSGLLGFGAFAWLLAKRNWSKVNALPPPVLKPRTVPL